MDSAWRAFVVHAVGGLCGEQVAEVRPLRHRFDIGDAGDLEEVNRVLLVDVTVRAEAVLRNGQVAFFFGIRGVVVHELEDVREGRRVQPVLTHVDGLAYEAANGVRVVIEELSCRDPELVWQLDHRVDGDVGPVLHHWVHVPTEERRDRELALPEQLGPRIRPAGHRHVVDALDPGQIPAVYLEQGQTEVGIRRAWYPADQDVPAGQRGRVRDVGLDGERVDRTAAVTGDHDEVETLGAGLHQQAGLHCRDLGAPRSQCRPDVLGLHGHDRQTLVGEPTLTGRALDDDIRTQVRQPVGHHDRVRLRRTIISRRRGWSSRRRRNGDVISVVATRRRKHPDGEQNGSEASELLQHETLPRSAEADLLSNSLTAEYYQKHCYWHNVYTIRLGLQEVVGVVRRRTPDHPNRGQRSC